MVKQRKETAELYMSQQREDLASVELAQAAVIESYLPAQMGEDEIKLAVAEVIKQVGAVGLADLGKEIGTLKGNKKSLLKEYGSDNKLAKQMIDLSLLANNMLSGEALTKFVKRSEELIK